MNPLDDIFDELERFRFIKKHRKYIQPITFWFLIISTLGFIVGGQ